MFKQKCLTASSLITQLALNAKWKSCVIPYNIKPLENTTPAIWLFNHTATTQTVFLNWKNMR